MRRVAIGGATGFVGAYLAAWFLHQGYEVLALARRDGTGDAEQRVRRVVSGVPDFGDLPLQRLRVLSCDLPDGWVPHEAEPLLRGVPFVNTIASIKHGEH
ncbi:MAG: SDR family oxidoreductase, partial [Candidatus Riflebacteria bacterium]|nr:SDR family oxidoreductase [Candidatus Riflebacteria bacterium]